MSLMYLKRASGVSTYNPGNYLQGYTHTWIAAQLNSEEDPKTGDE